jgi:hypothetical protein
MKKLGIQRREGFKIPDVSHFEWCEDVSFAVFVG